MFSSAELAAMASNGQPESSFDLAHHQAEFKEANAAFIEFTVENSIKDFSGKPICRHLIHDVFTMVHYTHEQIIALRKQTTDSPWIDKKVHKKHRGFFAYLVSDPTKPSDLELISLDLSKSRLTQQIVLEYKTKLLTTLELIRRDIPKEKKAEFDAITLVIKANMASSIDEFTRLSGVLGDIYGKAIEPLNEAHHKKNTRKPR
jgi:hypothetical protein